MRKLALAICAAACCASPAAANVIYNFQIATSTLTAAGGPYALDLFFIDGGNGTNNTAVVSIAGGGTASLQDSFFSESQLAFAPFGLLRFQVNLTTNPDSGPFVSPDELTVALLHNGAQFATTDPTGGNALVSITLPAVAAGSPSVAFTDAASGTFQPGFATATAVPEPSTAILGGAFVLAWGLAMLRRTFDGSAGPRRAPTSL